MSIVRDTVLSGSWEPKQVLPSPTDEEAEEPRLTRKNPFLYSKKLCPRCLTQLQSGSELGGWLVPQDYYCPKCGYTGTLYLEKEAGEIGEGTSE